MTRIVVLAFGTRGDVAPLTGLGARLRDELGVGVAIAAQRPYEELIGAAGLDYRLLPHDTEKQTRSSDYGQALVDGKRMRPAKEALDGMRADLVGVGEAMAEAAADADLVLCEGPVGALLGWHAAQAIGVPSMGVMLQPAYPTGDFTPPALGTRSFGRWGNRRVWAMADSGEKLFTPLIDDLRRTLGLPPRTRTEYQRERARTWPQLCGFSERVLPRPADWPGHLHVTGYWWPATDPAYTPTPELRRFLDKGPPPVYVSLGSTATSRGAQVSDTVRTALRAAGMRGIVHRGWAGLDGGDDPHLLTVDDLPHDWLLPKTVAAIHHCGAGTTAATLRAGVPSIAVPGIMDQPFWARRLHRLHTAPAPLRRVDLTADALTRALTTIAEDPAYRENARQVSTALRAEDGAATACHLVERLLDASPQG
ncbi:MAG: glycosyltransferase [Gordonia sp. (in: high G+C Gram-positive bacteria)]